MTRCYLTLLLLLMASLAGCRDSVSDPSSWHSGQVLSESVTELGHGYRQVARSQVNPPGHWEGIGHFVFVYYRQQMLCQCSSNEMLIAPDGRYAVYADDDSGRLTLFDAASGTQRPLSQDYVGFPYAGEWYATEGRAVLYIKKWQGEKNTYSETQIEIGLHDEE